MFTPIIIPIITPTPYHGGGGGPLYPEGKGKLSRAFKYASMGMLAVTAVGATVALGSLVGAVATMVIKGDLFAPLVNTLMDSSMAGICITMGALPGAFLGAAASHAVEPLSDKDKAKRNLHKQLQPFLSRMCDKISNVSLWMAGTATTVGFPLIASDMAANVITDFQYDFGTMDVGARLVGAAFITAVAGGLAYGVARLTDKKPQTEAPTSETVSKPTEPRP